MVCLAIAACQAPLGPDEVNLKALEWISDHTEPITHLTQQPATCLTAPNQASVQRGALLFSSPLLLGGQASKAGLSCAACHRNGRGNPDFVFIGVSGAPGTADVTHGLFSKVRADNVFNPVPIPDLAKDEGRLLVDRGDPGVLEAFLSAQIVEEFAGSDPDPEIIADLAAYIRALDDSVCAADQTEPQSWQAETALVLAGATAEMRGPSPYTDAMRAALGRIHERFPAPSHAPLRDALIRISRDLEAGTTPAALEAALSDLSLKLEAADQGSLYDERALARALR